jgi:predicted ABC-type ATPase
MIAGPNGSGKSTLLDELSKHPNLPLGHVLNPDLLEAQLRATGQMSFRAWDITTTQDLLLAFFEAHPLWPQIGHLPAKIHGHRLELIQPLKPGYFVAVLCDFMRRQWLQSGTTFTFETVMSSRDKPLLLHTARTLGFRTYLYFICTQDALINQARVSSRVQKGGHSVPTDKIIERYGRSLSLLKLAVENADRAYLFDNSQAQRWLVAEFENNQARKLAANPPEWVRYALPSE